MAGIFGDDGWFNEQAYDEEELYQGPTKGQYLAAWGSDLGDSMMRMSMAGLKGGGGGGGGGAMKALNAGRQQMSPMQRMQMKKMQQEMDITAADAKWAQGQATGGGEGGGGTSYGKADIDYINNGGPASERGDRISEVRKKQLNFAYDESKTPPDVKTAASYFDGNKTWGARFAALTKAGNDAAAQALLAEWNSRKESGGPGKPPTVADMTTAAGGGGKPGEPVPSLIADSLPELGKGRRYVWDESGNKPTVGTMTGSKADEIVGEQAAKAAGLEQARVDLKAIGGDIIKYHAAPGIGGKAMDLWLGKLGVDPSVVPGVGDTLGSGVNSQRWRQQIVLRMAAENYYRTLTGAAMPETEVKTMMENFAPGVMTGGKTAQTQLDLLIKRVETTADVYNKKHGKTTLRQSVEERGPTIIGPEGGPTVENAGTRIPVAAAAKLKANPSMRQAFDEKYGPGSADRVLGVR